MTIYGQIIFIPDVYKLVQLHIKFMDKKNCRLDIFTSLVLFLSDSKFYCHLV